MKCTLFNINIILKKVKRRLSTHLSCITLQVKIIVNNNNRNGDLNI